MKIKSKLTVNRKINKWMIKQVMDWMVGQMEHCPDPIQPVKLSSMIHAFICVGFSYTFSDQVERIFVLGESEIATPKHAN